MSKLNPSFNISVRAMVNQLFQNVDLLMNANTFKLKKPLELLSAATVIGGKEWMPSLDNSVQESPLCDNMVVWVWACMCDKSLQSHLILWNPMDCRLPVSFVHGILQARILERVTMLSSRGSSWPRDWTQVSCISCIGRWILYHQVAPGKSLCEYTWVLLIWILPSLF